MYLNPISVGKGPIVSIDIRSIGLRVESTARIVLCLASIFWQVRQHCMNCWTSCRRFRQLLLVSSGHVRRSFRPPLCV